MGRTPSKSESKKPDEGKKEAPDASEGASGPGQESPPPADQGQPGAVPSEPARPSEGSVDPAQVPPPDLIDEGEPSAKRKFVSARAKYPTGFWRGARHFSPEGSEYPVDELTDAQLEEILQEDLHLLDAKIVEK